MSPFGSKARRAAIEEAIATLTERVDALERALVDRAPASEIERLNYAFDLIADRAPASEVHRLNRAFELIEHMAPASEIERLNYAFELLGQRPPATETYVASLESERIVEVPWALGKYRGERRVAEVGYAFAEEHYLRLLLALDIPFLVGIDAAAPPDPLRVEAFHRVQADMLHDCIQSSSFDLVLCISTLEHIGRDNTAYGLDKSVSSSGAAPDIVAVRAMAGWVAPRGRLLLTVPFGRFEDHGWFINYDRKHLDDVLEASNLTVIEASFFGWMPGGWRQVEPEVLTNRGYRSHGASHAGGVALIELQNDGKKP